MKSLKLRLSFFLCVSLCCLPLSISHLAGAQEVAVDAHTQPGIVIDPGHGGEEVGLHFPESPAEKTLMLQLAQDLQTVLRQRGMLYCQTDIPLGDQVPFRFVLPPDIKMKSWALDIIEAESGLVVRTFTGEGRPPESLTWDARSEMGKPMPLNHRYGYILRLQDGGGNVWQQASDLETTEVILLEETTEQVKVKIEQVLFDFAKAELKTGMSEKLQKITDLIRDLPVEKVKLLIAGHTDEIGTEQYNNDLSLSRAKMVMRFLVEEEGIPSACMEIKGYGKSVLLIKTENSAGQAMNRRVEITLWLRK